VNLNKTIKQYGLVLFVLLLYVATVNAEVIEMTGIASIPDNSKQPEIEHLRERAMRNAMELALLHVKGGEISSSRSTLDTYTEERKSISNKNTESSFNRNASQSGARTRTTGKVRIVKLIKEWRDESAYYVNLKLSVDDEQDAQINVGDLWQRIGRPTIALTSNANRNGRLNRGELSLSRYIANDFNMNRLELSSNNSRFNVHIDQESKVNRFSELNTYSATCEISFSINDQNKGRVISNKRLRAGPKPDFSVEDAEKKCIGEVAQTLSHNLISELANIFNDEWNNGKEYLISIHHVPGNKVPVINEVIENAYLMKATQFKSYQDNVLSLVADYRGTEIELIDAVSAAFLLEGESVELKAINSNRINFELNN
jgi:hypothetical protein